MWLSALIAVFAFAPTALGQTTSQPEKTEAQPASVPAALSHEEIVAQCVQRLLDMQEGEHTAEWPYEGVYRVRGEIPIGYRIGGTGICGIALLRAPGFTDDQPRRSAIVRAVHFVIDAAKHPLMNPEYDGGYDVRGWGYTYGLAFLLECKNAKAAPAELVDPVEATIKFFIDAIQRTEIAKVGGWNYARSQGRDAVSPPSPFMTAPTLQVLFEAKKSGYEVDHEVIERGLSALERGRTPCARNAIDPTA